MLQTDFSHVPFTHEHFPHLHNLIIGLIFAYTGKMILVLLPNLNESEESILGFSLCRKLAKEGDHVYVTTTSTGEVLQQEIEKVTKISSKSKGSINLLQPEGEENRKTDWIMEHHAEHFGYLKELTDVQTVIGLIPGTEQTGVELKQVLKCKLKLLALSKIEVNTKNEENLRILLEEAEEILALDSYIQIHYKQLYQHFKIPNDNLKTISLPPSKGQTLVLLHRFSDTHESCLGYRLCQMLVKEGYRLLVSTTSSGKRLELESQKAKWLTDNSPGSITLLESHCGEQAEPSVRWIEHPKNNYFFHLSKLQKVMVIVGTISGTYQTSVDLKEKLGCKLVLAATAKIKPIQKKKICQLSEKADEIWSIGNETYIHFQSIFEEQRSKSCDRHQKILVQPLIFHSPDLKTSSRISKQNVLSVWTKSVPFDYEGEMIGLKGSDIDSFSVVGEALGKIRKESKTEGRETIDWHIHGLTADSSQYLQGHKQLKIRTLDDITLIEQVPWGNYTVFIAPDIVDSSFNFLALCALWLGVPTLVSSQSSIGKFLLGLSCPANKKAVVDLTGNPSEDAETWMKKINKEIFNENANPKAWAGELKDYLRSNSELWAIDLSGLRMSNKQMLPTSLHVSHADDASTTLDYLSKKRQESNEGKNPLHRTWSFASKVRHTLDLVPPIKVSVFAYYQAIPRHSV